MKRLFLLIIFGFSLIGYLFCQNSPLMIYGTGLDGSIYQKTAIYSDVSNGLLIEAPLDQNNNKLPIHLGWRGSLNNALYITGDNKIGIGTTNPHSQFHIGGNTTTQLSLGSISYGGNSGQAIGAIEVEQDSGDGGILKFQVNPWNQNGCTGIYTPITRMIINQYGNVGIGTTSPGVYKLNVNGSIRANEVVVNTTGADFVFNENYSLPDLSEVEEFINENKRLPDIASAKEMQQNGISISEMQTKLLQKIEELTIYTIEQKHKNEQQSEEIELLKDEIALLKNKLNY
jgi:hypothetical protein